MTHAETTDRASALEALTADERDILRQYGEDAEELGRRMLYRAHYGTVRAIAEDVLGAILRAEIDGPEALDERLHEEADSACTYTSANLRAVYASENWDAGPDEMGADLFDGVEDCGTLFGWLAFFAMRADIRERLGLMVGDVEGSAAGLDLDDEDTYPANRTADEDAEEVCECEDPGCACGGTCAEDATMTLQRIDMDGAAVRLCDDCAGDASESGVFGTADDDEGDEEPDSRWGLCADGGLLCPTCADGGNGSLAATELDPECPDDDQWRIVERGEVHENAECAHCGYRGCYDDEDPTPDLDRETVEDAAARTAFVLAWASAEEDQGRTYPGEDLDDVAPEHVPGRFRAWARDVLAGALGATARGDGIAEAWACADAEELGRALALSVGGWTDGLGEQDLPEPVGLPSMDADGRLWVDPADYRADAPSVEDLTSAAGRADSPEDAARRIRTAIEDGEDAEDVLTLAGGLLCGFGVESLDLPAPDEDGSPCGSVRYVNLGDTYTATLAYVEDAYTPEGRFLVACWGSLLEQAEEERTYATGETRCAYCGDWTQPGECHEGA